MEQYQEESKIGQILFELRLVVLGKRSNHCFLAKSQSHASIVQHMIENSGAGRDINYLLLVQFLVYGEYDCLHDTLIYSALLIDDQKVLDAIERAGCKLSEVVNTHGQNLLILSLFAYRQMSNNIYNDLILFLVEHGVEPMKVDNSGCHYFDYVNGYCDFYG